MLQKSPEWFDWPHLEAHLPGLVAALSKHSLNELESAGNPGIELFRQHGGCAMIVPKKLGGLGLSPVQACSVQYELGGLSPSLAVATTMHNFSVATIVEVAAQGDGIENLLLDAIANQKLYVASGFSEGKSQQHILHPTMKATRVAGGVTIRGVKKPCSLTHSMDLLTASVCLYDEGKETAAVVLVSAASANIERRPFWGQPALAGAESDEVILNDVFVENNLVLPLDGDNGERIQTRGLWWFELMITGSYLGMAARLVREVIASARGSPLSRIELVSDIETARAALLFMGQALEAEAEPPLERLLSIRLAIQKCIQRVAPKALALLGGMRFITSGDTSYFAVASQALSFHPPNDEALAQRILSGMHGEPFVL